VWARDDDDDLVPLLVVADAGFGCDYDASSSILVCGPVESDECTSSESRHHHHSRQQQQEQ
jgi:hypothetical protein